MPIKKYIINLTDKERKYLIKLVKNGSSSAKAILRANILLLSDTNAPKYLTVAEIAELLQTTATTVQNVKISYIEKGLDATLSRKKRLTPPVPIKVTCDIESHIIALSCSKPPEGYSQWTVRLLAEKCIELGYVDSISHMTVSRTLKKTNSNRT